jgi:DNA-binding transcriptional LysR family regulator
MNLRALDLNLLLTFEALYEARNVSRAAERLGLRQPALSAALARLRQVFGDELFVRAAGAMQPTPKALRIAPGIIKALTELRETLAGAAPFSPQDTARTFVIASSDYTTLVLIPPLVEAIEAEAPAIHLRIIGYDKADIPDLIDRGEVDVALGVFQSAPERAVRQFLCPERFVGVARRGHPAISGGAISMEDYIQAGHALVSLRRDAIGEIDKILRERNLSRSVVLTLPHMLVLPAILKRSDLLAALPQRVAQLVVGNELQIFDLPMNVPAWRIEMLWNASARSDQASAWLRSKIAFAAASADAKPERRKSADA